MVAVTANGAGMVHGPFWATATAFASTGGDIHAGAPSNDPDWMERVEPPYDVALIPRIKLAVIIARLPTIASDHLIARLVMEDERRFSGDRCVGMVTREYLIHDADRKQR